MKLKWDLPAKAVGVKKAVVQNQGIIVDVRKKDYAVDLAASAQTHTLTVKTNKIMAPRTKRTLFIHYSQREKEVTVNHAEVKRKISCER